MKANWLVSVQCFERPDSAQKRRRILACLPARLPLASNKRTKVFGKKWLVFGNIRIAANPIYFMLLLNVEPPSSSAKQAKSHPQRCSPRWGKHPTVNPPVSIEEIAGLFFKVMGTAHRSNLMIKKASALS
jgi:hypothetical protein